MTFPIYEFSKAFRDIKPIEIDLKEFIGDNQLSHQIDKKILWVSGGFTGECNIDRSSYPYIDSFPQEIIQAFKDNLFEIPNEYRPEPGAETLLRQGERIEQPPLKSIALIAREIGDYSVLAVATGQIDDKFRDKIVGYRCFWLDTRSFTEDNKHKPDGILTLLNWWFKNRQLCFNMKPPSGKQEIWQEDFIEYRSKIIENHLNIELQSDYPPFIDEISQGQFTRDSDIFSEISDLHKKAVKANQKFINFPVAWAWNVRRVTKPREFAAIACADHKTFAHYTELKLSLPAKETNKAFSPAIQASSIVNNNDRNNRNSFPLKEKIEFYIDNLSRDPYNINFLKDLLKFYLNEFDNKIDEYCWSLFQGMGDIARIKYPKEARDIYLLYILGMNNNHYDYDESSLKKISQNIQLFDQDGLGITDLLKSLQRNFKSVKKDEEFSRKYFKKLLNYRIIEFLECKTSQLLNPSQIKWQKRIEKLHNQINDFRQNKFRKKRKKYNSRQEYILGLILGVIMMVIIGGGSYGVYLLFLNLLDNQVEQANENEPPIITPGEPPIVNPSDIPKIPEQVSLQSYLTYLVSLKTNQLNNQEFETARDTLINFMKQEDFLLQNNFNDETRQKFLPKIQNSLSFDASPESDISQEIIDSIKYIRDEYLPQQSAISELTEQNFEDFKVSFKIINVNYAPDPKNCTGHICDFQSLYNTLIAKKIIKKSPKIDNNEPGLSVDADFGDNSKVALSQLIGIDNEISLIQSIQIIAVWNHILQGLEETKQNQKKIQTIIREIEKAKDKSKTDSLGFIRFLNQDD